MIPGKRYTPELVLSIAWRRKWLIAIPTVLVAVVACAVTYFLPDLYRSEASILVVPPRVSENYVRSAVTTRIEDRLRSINQQVRSRTKLERIIEDLNLYQDRRKTDIMQDIVDDMGRAIDVNIVQGDIFRIAFTSDTPRTAMQVTERLTTFFIDESLKNRTQLAEQADNFLNGATDASRRLRETEQKITEYKRKHDGELPTQENVNQQGLNNAQMQRQSVELSLDRAREQLQAVQRRIQDLVIQAETAAATPVVSGPEAPQTKAALRDAARAQLQGLEARYAPTHPLVTRAQTRLAELEREAAEESAGNTALGSQVVTNPLLASRLKQLEDARIELESVNRQIARYEVDQRNLSRSISEYQRRMELTPLRDTELLELTRDYATLRTSYDSLTAKKIDSQMSVSLEQRQIGEQFRVLDPARLPERPASPNRARLYLLSIMLAIGVGLGLAGVAEYLDHGLRSEDDVRLALALPVLATIPVIGTKKKLTLWKKVAVGSAAAAVLTVAVVGVVFFLR